MTEAGPGPAPPAGLEARAISKDFAGVRSVRDVSLVVRPGEVVGLVGPNGAGKTTLVNLMTGMVAPTAGRVVVDGIDIGGRTPARFARRGVVRTFQGLRLFEGLSVLDNVLVGAQRRTRPSLAAAWTRTRRYRQRQRADLSAAVDALAGVGLSALAGRPVTELSQGQRRRVELARALAATPSYLVLDEPGAGLDPEALETLADQIARRRRAGVGILLVEHDVGWVERVCDRVAGMVDGSVVATGTFAAVAAHPALVDQLRLSR